MPGKTGRNELVWWAVAAGGLALGAILGHAIGLNIRSDNLPFFDILGAVAGLAAGFGALCLWRSVRKA